MEMDTEQITMAEFRDAACDNVGRGRSHYGSNHRLLRGCETKPVKLTFETDKKAASKQTALYVVRKKLGVQVRILRNKNVLFIGPGEYEPYDRAVRGL